MLFEAFTEIINHPEEYLQNMSDEDMLREIKNLFIEAQKGGGYTNEVGLHFLAKFKAAQQQQPNIWVDVRDRLPEKAKPILMATKHWVGVGFYDKYWENRDEESNEPYWSDETNQKRHRPTAFFMKQP